MGNVILFLIALYLIYKKIKNDPEAMLNKSKAKYSSYSKSTQIVPPGPAPRTSNNTRYNSSGFISYEDRAKQQELKSRLAERYKTNDMKAEANASVVDSTVNNLTELSAQYDKTIANTTKKKALDADICGHFPSTEELIATGYSGNISFKRDFIGEAQALLNKYTY